MKRRISLVLILCAFLVAAVSRQAVANMNFDQAVELYGKGDYEEVVSILKDYVEKKPEPAAYWLIGYSLYKLKRFDEADRYFRDAYLIDPEFSPKQIQAFMPRVEEIIRKAVAKREGAAFPEETGPAVPALEEPPSVEESGPAPAQQQPASTEKEVAPAPAQKEVESTAVEKARVEEAKKPEPAVAEQPSVKEPEPQPRPRQQVRPAVRPRQRMTVQPHQAFPMTGGMAALMTLFATFYLAFLGIMVASYIIYALCLFFIAKKLDVAMPWLSFIPLAQLWPFVAAAGKPWWWMLILLFVPIANIIVFVYFWMLIAENLGRSRAFGLLTALLLCVPVLGLIMPAILAFKSGPSSGGMSSSDDEENDEEEDLEF